jgi:hypothetical protein
MNKSEIIRIILFILFFSVGAASLGTSVLCDDLVKYYQNVQFTQSARQSVEKLEIMNEDYGSILVNLDEDPNYIKRIAPVVSGSEYLDANAAYPKATARELAMARKAFADSDEDAEKTAIPNWLSRCSQSRNKMILFFSGVALILISFVCFRPAQNSIE